MSRPILFEGSHPKPRTYMDSFDKIENTLPSVTEPKKKRKPSTIRRWIHRAFLTWALISTLWLGNSVRTQGVDPATLRSSATVSVTDETSILEFMPVTANRKTALIFICGSGISAHAYAPLLRPIAEDGYAVFIVKLPFRFAPLESHKQSAVDNTFGLIAAHPEYSRWVLSGHSLGAALSCRAVQKQSNALEEMVLVGTTHPKQDNLTYLTIPVTKIYGSNDGVATPHGVMENKGLLPTHTNWVEIVGGNHSQFGHYGHQLFDGYATVTRSEQQAITRMELLKAINRVEDRDFEQIMNSTSLSREALGL